jgi:exodeoxyribonuclease VII large subunit
MLEARAPSTGFPLPQVISVTELTRLARQLLERQLPLMWVAGEISGCKRYDSGHCYFTLKDGTAQVECVMFRQKVQLLGWLPENGMQVEVRAFPTLYEPRGRFQLNIEGMRRSGLGALYEAFEKLKAKLDGEGLFDPARKAELPDFPQRIGLVTSPQAAALRDVLTTLRRRMPSLQVILYPAPVQGAGAGAKIAQAIATASARAECDVLLVCRGGGSIEDLWAYNEEVVARAIDACALPVVTGIGHEVDFTIADFVADQRAPTPTAAAELVSPDREELQQQVLQWRHRLGRVVQRSLDDRLQRLDYLARSLVHPGERIAHRREHLAHLANRLCGSWRRASEAWSWELRGLARQLCAAGPDVPGLERRRAEVARRLHEALPRRIEAEKKHLAGLDAQLRQLNPLQVLERGYSIAENSAGAIVRDSANVEVGETLKIRFARGAVDTEVRNKK